ncbi:MAG: YjjG family noncanonical pyrimidine nucleotidase [Clostridia bacterium]|nr:YjjG family noncanonical pyrimidine nucleotidase [Clostridia bacterium]
MIKNILFDLDDTLFDFHKAEKIALAETLRRMNIEPEEKILARYSELNLQQWKLLELGKLSREQVKVRRFQLLFEELGAECSAEKTTAVYEKLLGMGHYFVEGAEELLSGLYGRYRMYVVSNGTAAVQESRIKSSCIEKYLDGIFISQYVGYEKPRKEFFDYCFAHIPDFRREETVIVGDSLSSDIKGGLNSGITAIWFNPSGAAADCGILPDYEIRKLSELVPLISFFRNFR